MAHTTIEIETADGRCPAHVFAPATAGPWPAVLMYMDGIGMRPALVAMGERLAAAGYYTLLPDLFYRVGPYTAPEPAKLFGDPAVQKEWFAKVSPSTSSAAMLRDTEAFLAHFAAAADVRQPTIGITGYCMGGRLALLAAASFPDRVAAVAVYHPGGLVTDAPDSPHLVVGKIRGEVYVGGAMEDRSFTDEHKQRLEQALAAAGVVHTVVTYPARHGWVPSDTPVHDAAQAERHWETLLELLKRRL